MDIKQVMHTDFPSCHLGATLSDVYSMLADSGADYVVVVNCEDCPKGIVTKADIDMFNDLYGHINFDVSDVVFNKSLYMCWELDDAQIAVSIMNDRNESVLPVVNNNFTIVGIVEMQDIYFPFKNIKLENIKIANDKISQIESVYNI